MFAAMTLREQYRQYLSQLQTIYSANEAAIINDWVFESIGNYFKADLLKTPETIIPGNILQKLEQALLQLLEHSPIQYVIGEALFYHMKLKVNEHVLIPRPETEELVQLVIDEYKVNSSEKAILDIGTGSGCIAIALAKNISHSNVTAIDVNTDALYIAKENASTQKANVNFQQLNFLNETAWSSLGIFDVIVSNPPYIPAAEKVTLDNNVKNYEPGLALFVPDESPIIFYEKIAAFAKTHLAKEGKLFAELHENYAQQTAAMFRKTFKEVVVKDDLFGKNRMLIASTFI